jgi:hypothetical protein
MIVIAGAACCNPCCCCGLTCACGDGCCGDAWYGDNEPFRADAGAARFSDAGCRSAWLASPVPASERWTTQRAPAASNFEHKDSAASRLLSSTRMRVQMGSDPGVIAVFKTTGLYSQQQLMLVLQFTKAGYGNCLRAVSNELNDP